MSNYEISTDKSRLNVNAIHHFLNTQSYWAKGIPPEMVPRFIEHSMCFGVYYQRDTQVGFARVITDYTTFAYLSDVFVVPEHRGNGLAKMLVHYILARPELQDLRRFLLATQDAHSLYAGFGFKPLDKPEWFMQIHHPNAYGQLPESKPGSQTDG